MRLYAKSYLPGQPAYGALVTCAPDIMVGKSAARAVEALADGLGAVTAPLLVQRGDNTGA
jgi:hypothetical protein